MLVLSACAVIGIVGGSRSVARTGELVEWRETAIVGDKSAAVGLHVTATLQKNSQLFWISEFNIGEEQEARTEFHSIRPWEEDLEEDVSEEVMDLFFDSCEYNMQTLGEEMLISMPGLYGKAYINEKGERKYSLLEEVKNLVEAVKSGGAGVKEYVQEDETSVCTGTYMEKEFLLKDYMDYYPVFLDMEYGIWGWAYRDETGSVFRDEKDVYDAIASALAVPLDGTEKLMVKVTKPENSEECTIDFTMHSQYKLEMTSLNAGVSGGCYVACLPRSNGYDVEGIRGIYYMSCEQLDASTRVFESFEKVYSLNEEDEIVWMKVSEDEKNLLFVTEYDSDMYLHVVDLSAMKETQKVKIFGNIEERGTYGYVCVGENLLVVFDSRNQFSALDCREDGKFREVLTGDAKELEERFSLFFEATVAYRDGRLVICRSLLDRNGNEAVNSCDFAIAVYDASRLLYLGKYECSLSDGKVGDYEPVGFGWPKGLSVGFQ